MNLPLVLVLVLPVVIGVIMLISAAGMHESNTSLIKIMVIAIGIICCGGGSYLLIYLISNRAW